MNIIDITTRAGTLIHSTMRASTLIDVAVCAGSHIKICARSGMHYIIKTVIHALLGLFCSCVPLMT